MNYYQSTTDLSFGVEVKLILLNILEVLYICLLALLLNNIIFIYFNNNP